jgi:hypothetical protein
LDTIKGDIYVAPPIAGITFDLKARENRSKVKVIISQVEILLMAPVPANLAGKQTDTFDSCLVSS